MKKLKEYIREWDRKFLKGLLWYLYNRLLSFCDKEQKVDYVVRCNQWTAIRDLTKNSIVIDGGANVGHETAVFAQKGCIIHAFEPNPACFKQLQKRFRNSPKVHLYPYALSDRDGEATFYYNNEFSRWNKLFYSEGGGMVNLGYDQKGITVKCVDLCNFIEHQNIQINLVKLDIEGAEYDVLLKLIETGVYRKCNNILVETHERYSPELALKDAQLRALIQKHSINNIDLTWD